jgi:predicted phosphate transport protein (TIGR00153 family)
MSLNTIFQYFIPKDKNFFPLFEKASNNLIIMAELLNKAVNTKNVDDRLEIFKEIEAMEHIGDDITHQIYLELSKNFITPFDREDIHQLASAIDDVADYIHGSANRMNLYNVDHITEPIQKLAELILQAVIDLDKAIRELKNLKNKRAIADSCVRINNIENQADYVFDKAVGELFDYEKDAVKLIKYKEVLSALETATDMCEDAANVLESILVKHA